MARVFDAPLSKLGLRAPLKGAVATSPIPGHGGGGRWVIRRYGAQIFVKEVFPHLTL